ncbi:fibronectin type III domain-containing protein [Saccharothrix xinjiangensis]|uniref:Fibronectin type III domain-containing protein n=1 Tax=Saccharothrix xinjiangensis TaxID=204798 RepID=A0ABV9Y7B5_9PSEU
MKLSAEVRGRAPVALLLVIALTAVGAALAGARGGPGLEFLQPGHWVLNHALGAVFHVDGATKQVDARVEVPGADQGALVVQGDSSGYVVGRGKYTEFDKSTLRVQGSTPAPDELPVALQGSGGPYLVYRERGVVVRLGDEPRTIPVGGRLGAPVVTPDGTVWLHRVDIGRLCQLPRGTDAPLCPVEVPAGEAGGLTVVGDEPLFVDTSRDVLHVVGDNGLGRSKAIGADLPDTARVAPGDADGRVPVLDPAGTLYLIDTADVVGDRPGARDVVVPLPPGGEYTGPESTGSTVAVLDRRGGALLTYDSAGTRRAVTPLPPETGAPRLVRGEDRRLYVEGGQGEHVLVVDPGGEVTGVPTTGVTTGTGSSTAAPPATTTAQDPGTSPPDREQPGDGQRDTPTQQDTRAGQDTQARVPAPPVVPAGPPGAPAGVTAAPGDGSVALTWGAAAENGAPVTAYHVSWNGGGVTVTGDARGATASGLANGTAYTFTVVAENRAGRGSPATAQATPKRPRTITVSRGPETTYNENCEAPQCAFFLIEMHGFEPNTRYEIIPFASRWGDFNPGTTRTTDAQGSLVVDDEFPFNGDGQQVWVVVDGQESPRYTWRNQ